MSLVKQGLPEYGMAGVGTGRNSEGSELIVAELENYDDRPLWIFVWGSANTLAQALYKIRDTAIWEPPIPMYYVVWKGIHRHGLTSSLTG